MYGYLHLGRVISFDPASGGYELRSIGLARTSRWGPVSSAVPGLLVGDRVVLGATGTSRDELVIIAKVGATFPGIADIPGLIAALAGKADDSEIIAILSLITALDGRLDVVEPLVSSHTTTLGTHASELVSLDGRLDAMEAKTGYIDVVTSAGGRPATGLFNGRAIFRSDKGFLEFYDLAADKWQIRGVVTVGALADITDPVTEQIVFLTTDRSFYRWNGTAWSRLITGIRVFEGTQPTSSIAMTTTLQDLASVSFSTVGSASVITVDGTIDGSSTGTNDIGIGRCLVNATPLTGEIHWGPIGRASYGRTWKTTLAAGDHTVKLQGREFGSGSDSFTTFPDHTNLVVTVYDA